MLSRSKKTKEIPAVPEQHLHSCHRGPLLWDMPTGGGNQLPSRAGEHWLSYRAGHVNQTGWSTLQKQ